jgi:hypothetical protein
MWYYGNIMKTENVTTAELAARFDPQPPVVRLEISQQSNDHEFIWVCATQAMEDHYAQSGWERPEAEDFVPPSVPTAEGYVLLKRLRNT